MTNVLTAPAPTDRGATTRGIRVAVLADIPDIVQMGVRFIRETSYAERMAVNPDQMAKFLTFLLAGDTGIGFVSVGPEGGLTGMILLLRTEHFWSGEVVVSELAWWVNPEARGQGIRLLKRAEQWAREVGAAWLHMIAPTVAVGRLYERLGFEPLELGYQRRLQ